MEGIRRHAPRGRLPQTVATLLLLNILVGALPLASAFSWASPEATLAVSAARDATPMEGAATSESPPLAATPALPLSGATARAPVPLSVGAGWQNWTPYSPSAFTHGS